MTFLYSCSLPMKDLFTKYRYHKLLIHVGIFSVSLICAFCIHTLFLSDTLKENLQANILWWQIVEQSTSWIRAERDENNISLKLYENLENIESISFSLIFDSSVLDIQKPSRENALYISEQAWIISISLSYDQMRAFRSGDEILRLPFIQIEQTPTIINIYNAYYNDTQTERNFLQTRPLSL